MATKPKRANDNRKESANKLEFKLIMTDSAMKETIKAVIKILMIIAALLGVGSTLNPENIPPQLPEIKIEQMESEKQ
ncbi:MAG: hypothetical protein QNJ33_18310 [Crocosphaera sp.]|nr:hypothetical protein [Crocosphaera sp.]